MAALIRMALSCEGENARFAAIMQQTNTLPAAAHSHRAAYLLLAGVVVLWGCNWPVMKIGLSTIPPFWFAGLRVFLGAATLFIVLAITRNLALPGRRDIVQLISGGIFQVAIYMGLVNLALFIVLAITRNLALPGRRD